MTQPPYGSATRTERAMTAPPLALRRHHVPFAADQAMGGPDWGPTRGAKVAA
ncbi:hypothetical protein ACIA8C_31225 [Nocardia sp. NPDC051321]|uniref:hypothetical protein n=1 Tax=Nocardia sp. NPDC051321 TaxID=3364323 RepID=UPI0037A88487